MSISLIVSRMVNRFRYAKPTGREMRPKLNKSHFWWNNEAASLGGIRSHDKTTLSRRHALDFFNSNFIYETKRVD